MLLSDKQNQHTLSALQPHEQLLVSLEGLAQSGATIMLEDATPDTFATLSLAFSRYGYRCIAESVAPVIYRFVPLDAEKQRIVVTATNDNFHFMQPVMRLMRSQGHWVSALAGNALTQETLLNALRHCDVAWFEWGDGAIIPASKMPKYCRIVCRIHRYELYGEAFLQADWNTIDEVIFVSQAMKKRFISVMGKTLPPQLKMTVLANLTEHLPAVKPTARRNPWHIACVARFAAQKNLVMLLPIMQALVKQDPRYTLFIAGRVEDQCLYESFCELICLYGLRRNIVICGALPAENMPAWYADKSFLLSASYHESQGMGVFEAMLAGLKPVVFQASGGLAEYLPSHYLFLSTDEAVARIIEGNAQPDQYIHEAQILLKQHELPERYTSVWQIPMNETALFSIVIPCYNRERYLLPAVCSALNQRDRHFEVVVVDDGSTDGSLESIAHIDDPRLRIVRKAHTNAPDTRNRCITEARGAYLVWLDSDDLLHPNAITHYRTLLQRWPQTDVISCGLETLQGEKQYFALFNHAPANWLSQLPHGNFISNPGCCVRRTLYAKAGNYDTHYLRAHDYEFWSRAVGVAHIAFTPQCNIAYRLHDDNLTGLGKPVDATYEYRIFQSLLKRYRSETLFPGKSRKEIETFIQTRRETLVAACDLEHIVLVLNAITTPLEQLLGQIQQLGAQQDKHFHLLIVSDKALPFSSLPVLIADSLEAAPLREYLNATFPKKFCRAFSLHPDSQAHPQMISDLKHALLKGISVAPYLHRLCA
ncbi:TPA: glycosyltransferase [Enterobacter hormaechei subsp. oharae]|uniref:glycosyltransferase n=1 Tax=Enterobacter hormaechei TaxID=158836 RepID=UPI00263B0914|nr:glycosyltransferase [Enterobacter hormaechei]MDN4980808.1 glycosyltransferase [Enterobacter hormaechei]